MNLYLVVEGHRTEPRLFRHWLPQLVLLGRNLNAYRWPFLRLLAAPASPRLSWLWQIAAFDVRRPGTKIAVAVGTPVTGRPPHRSLHAQLAHKAPALGRNAQSLFGKRV